MKWIAVLPARRVLTAGLSLALSLLAAWPARADAPQPALSVGADCVFERYVSLAAKSGFDAALAEEVRKDLAAELSSRGFGVCSGRAATGELVAEVELVQREPALVAIEVEDYTTGKRVARDVRLSRIPPGGLALAIAIATDELLRASWAELMLRRSALEPEQASSDPPVVARNEPSATSTVTWRRRDQTPLPAALLLAFDYAHTRQRYDGFALDGRMQLRPFGYGLFELGLGGAMARPVATALGTARAAGVLALLTVGGCGQPLAHLSLCGGARGTLQWTRFQGRDAKDARSLRADLSSFVLAGVAQARLALVGRLFVLAELSLGAALLAARATDGKRTLLAIDGLVVAAALGVGVSL